MAATLASASDGDQPAVPESPAGSRSCGCGRSARSRSLGRGGGPGFWPQVAAIGAGYAILIALAWRRREQAVAAIEERDGVRFYVEPSSALRPVQLVRTPGLHRDRSARRATRHRLRSRPDSSGSRHSGSRRRANAIAPPAAAASAAIPASTNAGAGTGRLGEPAGDRAADRRRAQEDDE